MVGCSNHNCLIEKPKGMGTNGNCNCLKPLGSELELVIKRRLLELNYYKNRVLSLEIQLCNERVG